MRIKEIVSPSEFDSSMASEWLSQLTGTQFTVTDKDIKRITLSPNSHLFILENDEGIYCGMVTVSICHVLSYGICAWLDDVFVPADQRKAGYGKLLIEHAIDFARQEGASMINLTSSAPRTAAIGLYLKMGFVQRDTNVFRKKL